MVMRLDSLFKLKFTSKKKKEVASMNNQMTKKMRSEGKKPIKAVETGRASIPAPIVVPLIKKMAPM
jgi:hypothetical protein